MKKLVALVFILVLAYSVAAQSNPAKLSDLSWLAGCWEARKPGNLFVLSEQWMKPDGGIMLGMGRTVEDRKAVDWEFMSIEQNGDSLTFFARPKSNQHVTAFKMLRISASEVVFENPTHDFPQRVIYRLPKVDSLAPSIEGTIDGKLKTIEFQMQRVECR